MGRLNIGQLKYLLYQVARIVPKGYRKPVYLVASILGLLIFMSFMISITHSIYLLEVRNAIYSLFNTCINNGGFPFALLFVCLLLYWLSRRYYKELKVAISFGYLIIFILAFLPIILRS